MTAALASASPAEHGKSCVLGPNGTLEKTTRSFSDRHGNVHWGRMIKLIVGVAACLLVAGCVDRPNSGAVVRDEDTAIRIGVAECWSSQPPRKELHAEYRAGKWRVWWGDEKGAVFTFMVNVDAATGAAGSCTVGGL
jgi:hypothetical protein